MPCAWSTTVYGLSGLNRRKLSSLIQKMEDNSHFRDNDAKMFTVFRQREHENKSVELFEKLIPDQNTGSYTIVGRLAN